MNSLLINIAEEGSNEIFNDAEWKGQVFTAPDNMNIRQVSLKLYRDGAIGDVTVSIQETTSDLPNGTILGTYTLDGDTFGNGSANAKDEHFLYNVNVVKGTKYAIVVAAPDQAVNYLYWATSESSYNGASAVYSDDSGSSWDTTTGYNSYIRIYGLYTMSIGTREITQHYPVISNSGVGSDQYHFGRQINLVPEDSSNVSSKVRATL